MSKDEWTQSEQRLTYLWTQYKYRHELCWHAIYKITVAVIGLAVVPYILETYVNDKLIETVSSWLVVPPVIAIGLACLGIFVINNELRLFAATKLAHHRLEDQLLGNFFQPLYEQITAEKARWTLFDHYAHTIVIVLFLLSIGNAIFVLKWWIPSLTPNTQAQSLAGSLAVAVLLIFLVIGLFVWLLSYGTLGTWIRTVRDSVTVLMSRIKRS